MLIKPTTVSNAIFFAVLLGLATPGLAAPPEGKGGGKDKGGEVCEEGLFSPVVLLKENPGTNSGRPVQMKPDGTCLTVISVFGDLTHNGVQGQRYFLVSEQQPDGSYDLVVYGEDEVRLHALVADPPRTILYVDHIPRWSNSGDQLAYAGSRLNPNSGVFESGIFVGDVLDSDIDGVPDTIANERQVVANEDYDALLPWISWASDDARIAYSVTANRVDPVDSWIITREIFVVELSDPPATYEIVLDDDGSAFHPRFSPSPGDDRLAFTTKKRDRTCVTFDIFVVEVPTGYDGTWRLFPTQITDGGKKNVCFHGYLEWSPDSNEITFRVSTSSGPVQIYKTDSNGTGGPVKLTNSKDTGYWVLGWRD